MGAKKNEIVNEKNKCFVIMPISDPEGYEKGHFRCVYEDLFMPAIRDAGFEPKRADDDKSSNMIQESIIRDIIESPMAICDLSSRNPNVLFELGVRQAFDLPVVLVQEQGTSRIFDISTINTLDYRKNLIYREVIEDRRNIADAITATKDGTKGINSIIKLLKIAKAQIPENSDLTDMDELRMMIFSLQKNVADLKDNIGDYFKDGVEISSLNKILETSYKNQIDEIQALVRLSSDEQNKSRYVLELKLLMESIESDSRVSLEVKKRLKKYILSILSRVDIK